MAPPSPSCGSLRYLVVSLMCGALSGCLTADPSAPVPSAGSIIERVQSRDELGSPLVSNQTGAIVARVTDAYDVPVWGAHAALIGTDHATDTNETGSFQFAGLAPGEYFL